jgi:hypothetical protein
MVLSFIKSIFIGIFMEAQKTPGVEVETHENEGAAKPISDDVLAAAYGLHDRDKGEAPLHDARPDSNS